MKRIILSLLLIMFIASFLNAETKLKMEIWNRWSYTTTDGENTKNEMALKRGYLRFEPKFSNKIKGRFNVDFFSDDDADDGAGLKIKYAYLDFSEILPIKDAKITAGLMKTYFGTIYDWNYTTIEKDPSDKYKFVSSTDYGVGISGYFPEGYGSYAIAAYNGEGYKKTGDEIDNKLDVLANIRFSPITGITVGGSYYYKSDSEEDDRIAIVTKLAKGSLSILGQYLIKGEKNVISIMPTFKVNNTFDLVSRYDEVDDNNEKESFLIGGFNYHIMRDSKNNPKLFVQTNFKKILTKDVDENEIMVQLRWIFSEKI